MSWDPMTEREIDEDAVLAAAEEEKDLERADVWTAPIPDPSDILQERKAADR